MTLATKAVAAAMTAAGSVSRETRERLDAYLTLLLRWNPRINLIGRDTERDAWQRHIEDSLQLADLIPAGIARAIDIGSGGGLPGLVLSLVCNLPFTLVESDRRKAVFLSEAIRVTGAPASVMAKRIEACTGLQARLITARAFAPLPRLLALAAPHLATDGFLLLPEGANAEDELTQAASQWHMQVERFVSRTAGNATILRLSEIRPVRVTSN